MTPAVVNIRTESHQRDAGADRVLRRRRRHVAPVLRPADSKPGQPQTRRATGRAAPAPASSSPRKASSSPTTTSSKAPTRSRSRSTARTTTSGTRREVVGRDPLTDSALIELTEKPDHSLPEVKFGDSSQMEPGDWVMAIGNPFNLSHTVSVGVISALKRPFPVGDRPHARHAADRRGDQPGQLRRPAAQRARRSHRHEHGDLLRRAAVGQHRHRLRRADQHRAQPAAAAARAARSRAA